MILYCTSRNTNPYSTLSSDCLRVVYLGTSLEEAEKLVGDFRKYEIESNSSMHWPTKQRFVDTYTALPSVIPVEYLKFYSADGYWYSIVKFEFEVR